MYFSAVRGIVVFFFVNSKVPVLILNVVSSTYLLFCSVFCPPSPAEQGCQIGKEKKNTKSPKSQTEKIRCQESPEARF